MRKEIIFFLIVPVFFSCMSIDVEKKMDSVYEEEKIKEENKRLKESLEIYTKKEEYFYNVEPELIPVTKYVIVDSKETVKQEKSVGKDAVRESMANSIVPLKDYVGGTSFFDYDENTQFPIFTKQLSMTTIILNDDEQMGEGSSPFLSDTTRWEITGDVWQTEKGERQLIMIKPKSSGLETNMLIVTNKRLYHFVLYSTSKDYQPMVQFRYPLEKPFITSHTKKSKPTNIIEHFDSIDMSNVSFNYKILVSFFSRNVDWIPSKVYDDGSHTYIVIPEVALQKEFPAIWENGVEITNYEIHPDIHNLIVVNKLINKLTLRVGKKKVVIKKLKGLAKDFSYKTKKEKEEEQEKNKEEEKEVEIFVNKNISSEDIDIFNFNYKIVLEKGQKKEDWLPIRIYDSESELYIGFKEGSIDKYQIEFRDGEKQITNYEIQENGEVLFHQIPENLVICSGSKKAKIIRFASRSYESVIRR